MMLYILQPACTVTTIHGNKQKAMNILPSGIVVGSNTELISLIGVVESCYKITLLRELLDISMKLKPLFSSPHPLLNEIAY